MSNRQTLSNIVIPAKAGISASTQYRADGEIPACAGMTKPIYLVIFTFFTLLLTTNNAFACDIRNFAFGEDTADIVEQFDLDPLFDRGARRVEIATRGGACPGLPNNTEMKFVFLYNTFVQVVLERLNSKQALLDHAEKYLSAAPRPNEAHPDSQTFQHIWGHNNHYLVMYSTYQRGTTPMEYLEITSRNHEDLFEKAHAEEEKMFNDSRR